MTLKKTPSTRSRLSNRSSQKHQQPAEGETNKSTTTGADEESTSGPEWLAGHLNHLTLEQSDALENFKKECVEHDLYTPAEGEKAASHDDATLLRFLRARKFEVNGALEQFKSTEEWRKANQIETLYENFDVDSYEEARRVYPQWTGRRDRRGIPIYVFVIRNLNSKNMAAYTSGAASKATSATHSSSKVPPRLLRLFALYENMVRFALPLCSRLERPNPETPIVSTTNIVDISGVGLKQFWNLKGHMQDASVLATAHYPETLDRIFIIGAPAFFPTVWNWIKRWFDPVTTSKIFILSAAEVKTTLPTFMDPSNIPTQYGGELEWEWGSMPSLDEPARAILRPLENMGDTNGEPVDGEKSNNFVKGPLATYDDRIEVFGSVDGKPRRISVPIDSKKDDKENQPPVPDTNRAPEVTATATTSASDNEKVALSKDDAELNEAPAQAANPVAS